MDDSAAAFHAVPLLGQAAPGSHEPALTAARQLAVLGQLLPLYAHLAGGRAQGEETAEGFRSLAGAPDSILLELGEQWRDSADEVVLLGVLHVLLDALSERSEPERFEAVLLEFLRESPHLDLVRYLAAAIVARHHESLIEALRARPWPVPARGEIVADVLGLLADR